MNLALHHLRKEVSHVRLRWLLWLALLALQMAVNLEWIAPMPADFKWDNSLVNPSWLFLMRPVIWGVAFWLVVSSAPEDRPGNPDRFLGARPLPVWCYFLGRMLAFLVLIVAPLAVQEALYLWFSERPWHEVVMGAGEAAFHACAFLGWWLPFSLLWRRTREVWCGVGILLVTPVLVIAAGEWALSSSGYKLVYAPDPLPYAGLSLRHALQWSGWFLVGAVILAVMAGMHLRRGWKLGLRLAAVFVLVAGTLLAILHVPLPNPSMRPTAQSEVQRVAPGLHTAFTGYKFERVSVSSNNSYNVIMQGLVDGYPAEYTPHWRRQQVTLQYGDTKRETARSWAAGFDTAFHQWLSLPVQSAVSSFFPKDTLYRWSVGRGVDAGTLETPALWGRVPDPISVEGKFEIDWLKWEKEVDLPVMVGSTVTTAGTKWTVLAVDPHFDLWAAQTPGVLCVTLRLEHPAQGFGRQPWDWTQRYMPMLYAPKQGLVFVIPWMGERGMVQPQVGVRAESTTWQRHIFRMAWPEVLAPQGPVENDDETELRLVVLKRSYAGTSSWAGALPPMTLPDGGSGIDLRRGDSVLEDEAFLTRLRDLPKLKDGATVEEAQLYLADILETLKPIWTHPWKDQLDLILDRLEPLARMHPALLLQVGSDAPWPLILGRLSTAPALRDAILTEMPVKPWLGRVVDNRPEWQPLMREKAALIMSSVTPKDGLHFSRVFMTWRDPAHLPWLLQVMEAGVSNELYLYCRSFPEYREAADTSARRAALAAMRRVGPVVDVDETDLPRGLALGLRAGLPEALERAQHLLRVAKPGELNVLLGAGKLPEAFGIPDGMSETPAVREKLRKWLSEMRTLTPANFRFDEKARVWLRMEPPATAPKAPEPQQRSR